ncbi:histidine kinase [Clostridium sp. 'White wine YQ']|nr:histidine kinase [Clostridium sp. 'White wine YQ']
MVIYVLYKINPIFMILGSQIISELFEFNELVKYGSMVLISILGIVITNENKFLFYLLLFITYTSLSIIKSYFEKTDSLEKENRELRKNLTYYNKLVENSKDFEEQILYTTQLEERNKISQQMHDKIGHVVAGSLMQLEAAKSIIEEDTEASKKLLEGTISVLRNGIEDIRITLRNIKPLKEELGINRLKLEVDRSLKHSSINGYINFKGELNNINYNQWKVIIDNTKEALTNTIKYSKAKDFWVNIHVMNKMLKVELKDNGVGSSIITKGLGIAGMEQRVQELGGNITLDGSSGFSIVILMPI